MQSIVTDDTCRTAGRIGGFEQGPRMGQSAAARVSLPQEAVPASPSVSAVAEAIAARIGPDKYRIWFKNSTTLALAGDYLRIGVPNSFLANWLESHFAGDIVHAAKSVTGGDCKLAFSIDATLAGRQRPSKLANQTGSVGGVATTNGSKPCEQRAQSRPDNKLKLTFNTFVVGPSNELAYNAANAVTADKQSPFNPLFVHGGYGVGKTHLLQGICSEMRKTRPGANWLYMPAEDFANQFVLALKSKKLEAFRRRMRQTDLLVIDDIHFMASKTATQEEFLHTFNTIDMGGRQVVLASDAHPKLIGQLSEKLVNRFISGMVVKIDPPDFTMRCEICRRYAVGLRKHFPEPVIEYVAENLKTNVRELQGAVLKLVAFSSLANSQVDLAVASEVLAEHLERCDPVVHITDIESAAAEHFGITTSDIHSPRKDRTVALARHFSMYLARKHTRMSSSEIGRFSGGKNHATVLLACKKVEQLLKNDVQLNWGGPDGNRVARASTIIERLEKAINR